MGVRKRIHKAVHALMSDDDESPRPVKVKSNPESDYLDGNQDNETESKQPRQVKVIKKQKPDAITEFFSFKSKPKAGGRIGTGKQRRTKQPKAPKMSKRVMVSAYGGGRILSRRKVRGARRIGYL